MKINKSKIIDIITLESEYLYSTDFALLMARSEILNIDHFNPNIRVDLFGSFMNDIKPGELIIWDSWFAVVECGLPQADLDQNPHLKKVFETRDRDHEREIVFAIYERK